MESQVDSFSVLILRIALLSSSSGTGTLQNGRKRQPHAQHFVAKGQGQSAQELSISLDCPTEADAFTCSRLVGTLVLLHSLPGRSIPTGLMHAPASDTVCHVLAPLRAQAFPKSQSTIWNHGTCQPWVKPWLLNAWDILQYFNAFIQADRTLWLLSLQDGK